MSHPVSAIRFNDALGLFDLFAHVRQSLKELQLRIPDSVELIARELANRQDLIACLPSSSPSGGELHKVQSSLFESLEAYAVFARECAQLLMKADHLITPLTMLIQSPTCSKQVVELAERAGEVLRKVDAEDDCSRNLLNHFQQLTANPLA
ncbi:MAG TPA: hypothetical protein VFV39_12420 [Limnobacter sp.]|nr:hypothetical protein [Limnobacter sp.]